MSMQSTTQNVGATDVMAWLDWLWLRMVAAAAAVGFRFEPMLVVLMGMSLLDIVTAATAAKSRGEELHAQPVFDRAWGKLTIWLIAAGGYLFDQWLHLGVVDVDLFKFQPSFGAALCGIFMVGEFIANLRNGRGISAGRSARYRDILHRLEQIQGEEDK